MKPYIPVEPGTVHFAKFDDTGRILFIGAVSQDMIGLQGENIVAGEADPLTDWVKGGIAIIPRPANPVTLDGMTLKNLPVPCVITVEGVAHDCTDDHAELSFSHPGTFTVTVAAFPALDATFEVTQA